jgi:hypothetical protein
MNRTRPGRWACACLLAASLAAGLAACGGADNEQQATSAASGSPSVRAAQATVQRFAREQPAIAVASLPDRPATGLKVGVVTCEFPSCQEAIDGVRAAAKALGWTVDVQTTQIAPEAYVDAWNRMLQRRPDLIVYTGLMPNKVIASQLQQVGRGGIPTAAIGAADPPGGPLKAVFAGPPQARESGRLMGEAVVADQGEGARAVFVWDPAQAPILGPAREGFTAAMSPAGGQVDTLDVSAAEIGKGVPTQVASYLQRHPDVKVAAFAISDMAAGVAPALRSAGIDGVKLIARWPQASDVEAVADGGQWTEVAEEGLASGYRAVDALARLSRPAGTASSRARKPTPPRRRRCCRPRACRRRSSTPGTWVGDDADPARDPVLRPGVERDASGSMEAGRQPGRRRDGLRGRPRARPARRGGQAARVVPG